MKKRIFSTLLALCMLLCLVPTAAFAEESTETPPACSCETACTAESMNAECPVCGAEDALPEKCAMCAQPKEEVSDSQPKEEVSTPQPEEEVSDSQPKGEASDPQPETALTALIGGSETPAAGGTVTEVGNEPDLTAAIANVKVDTVKLTGDIIISSSLTVKRAVTLDLNGHVLKYENDQTHGGLLAVESGGHLTIIDSNSNAPHKFKPNSDGLWVLDENGSETVTGGVITGGTGYQYQKVHPNGEGYTEEAGGAVCVKVGGSLFMTGGNIVGCSAMSGKGGGVHVEGNFSMTGGSIIGCAANRGGGVHMAVGDNESATFSMSGNAIIRCCKAVSSNASGGGVYVLGNFTMSDKAAISNCECIADRSRAEGGGVCLAYHNKTTTFTMSGSAVIENCKVTASSQNAWTKSYGGGVYVSAKALLTLKDQAAIRNCSAENTAGGATYGGGIFAEGTLTIADHAEVGEGCSAAVGSGIYMEVGSYYLASQNLYANGGVIAGEVVLNNSSTHGATLKITGSDEGVTEFKGSVLNNNGIIEKGKFTGEVTNNGTITGGTFTSTVSNNGTITGGTFSGGITGTPALATGSGTKSDPYQIGTAEGLKWFRDKVNNAKTKEETKICAVMTADIDLKNDAWTPIGQNTGDDPKDTLAYSGTFNGNGHTISGLNVTGEFAYSGLFGYTEGAAIRDLTVAGKVTSTSTDSSTAVGSIIGRAKGSTIENCGNLCAVTAPAGHTGGIVGYAAYMDDSSGWITGCYNAGKISGGDYAGGIVGTHYDDMFIYDCYNVGAISGNCAIGGIAGSGSFVMLFNCYNAGIVVCPGGTATPGGLFGSGSGQVRNSYYLKGTTADSHIGAIEKSAEEFADGTVLKALKDGKHKSEDPWADECQYVDAAGLTLPVFNGQGDAHNHQSSDWKHNETEHWQVCTCGVVFNKAAHSGGKATCKAKAVCEFCKASYGSLDPNSHANLKHIAAKAATAAEEGNIEYWYCDGCGKYFSDAAATKEITKADTVTAKLPKTTSPQPIVEPRPTAQPQQTAQPQPTVQPVSPIPSTGDTANPALWFALLFVSGGAALGTTIIRRKKKQ